MLPTFFTLEFFILLVVQYLQFVLYNALLNIMLNIIKK